MRRGGCLLALTLVPALAACAVGPDFHTPPAPAVSVYTPQPLAPVAGQSLVPGVAVDPRWWQGFASPELNALIDRALAANSDLAATRAALKAAREAWLAQRGVLLPQAEASAGSSRNRSSAYISSAPGDPALAYSLQTAQVTVGYTLDLFGGGRRQIEGARAQYMAARYQSEAARITLINSVAVAAFQEAGLRAQVAAQARLVAIAREQLAILHRQMAMGQVARSDVLAGEAVLEQAQGGLSALSKALAFSQDGLAYLTGRAPGDGVVAGVDLARLVLPRDLPLSLPSELVRQRADVRVAEENLHAASAAVGVAVAARLPAITLVASAGGYSDTGIKINS